MNPQKHFSVVALNASLARHGAALGSWRLGSAPTQRSRRATDVVAHAHGTRHRYPVPAQQGPVITRTCSHAPHTCPLVHVQGTHPAPSPLAPPRPHAAAHHHQRQANRIQVLSAATPSASTSVTVSVRSPSPGSLAPSGRQPAAPYELPEHWKRQMQAAPMGKKRVLQR